jgi:hypothetical protein
MYFSIKDFGKVFFASEDPVVLPKYARARKPLIKDTFAEW